MEPELPAKFFSYFNIWYILFHLELTYEFGNFHVNQKVKIPDVSLNSTTRCLEKVKEAEKRNYYLHEFNLKYEKLNYRKENKQKSSFFHFGLLMILFIKTTLYSIIFIGVSTEEILRLILNSKVIFGTNIFDR